VRTYVSKNSKF